MVVLRLFGLKGVRAGLALAVAGGFGEVFVPAFGEAVWDAELVEGAGDDEVDDVVHRGGVVVEARVGGHDDGAGVVEFEVVVDIDAVEGCFAVADEEWEAFFEAAGGGAGEEFVAVAGGDGAEGVGGAGEDGHAVVSERARAEGGADVGGGVEVDVVLSVEGFGGFGGFGWLEAGEGVEGGVGGGFHAELVLEEALAVGGDDEVELVSEFDGVGDEASGVGGAGGAGDADDEAFGGVIGW